MLNVYTYEPAKGYSVPVVRVLVNGRPHWTLSFTTQGEPINLPAVGDEQTVQAAWAAWQKSFT